MWRLVIFTVFIFTSITSACYKNVEIHNQLDGRITFRLTFSEKRSWDFQEKIEKGRRWKQPNYRGDDLVNSIQVYSEKDKVYCQRYDSSGTGYWHFIVEYEEHSYGTPGDCKVTRIGGFS